MDTTVTAPPPRKRVRPHPQFECIVLTLQGGGALGAYQAGVYQALDEAGIRPDWIAGISIGAINAAIIAGNPPEQRVARLRQFWETVSTNPLWGAAGDYVGRLATGVAGRRAVSQASALAATVAGAPGFFAPRTVLPYLTRPGSVAATSYYDTNALRLTLERLVDFDRINAGGTRLSVGAVNVKSGNFVYFDTTTHKIGPAHVMASGALPPGFPAIEIDGEHYWDGGTVSNTPLQWVLQFGPRRDTLTFQVDLWNARGALPRNVVDVETRRKEILYSSRTRDNVDRFAEMQRLRHAIAKVCDTLPKEVCDLPEAGALRSFADHKVYSIVHLIYRPRHYETFAKDYEFSRLSMEGHWAAGHADTVHTLAHPEALARPANSDGVRTFDAAMHAHAAQAD
ncbi:MAG: patatin-like phospholipase family protein [Alphaproteobacteria bacterium]|nr:patatin-like phospholipase family protein [Alphaproteobacteria bacterium]